MIPAALPSPKAPASKAAAWRRGPGGRKRRYSWTSSSIQPKVFVTAFFQLR
jgi:hypothetical protein